MPKPSLTKKQRQLAAEVTQLLSTLGLNPDEIVTTHEGKFRTIALMLAHDQVIRSAVILQYVLMDAQLNWVMGWHFFGKKRSFRQSWKTKRFKSFNHFILEKLHLLQKLDFVKSIHAIPKWVASDLGALNDLRNGLAHSFFLQNSRRKPEWKGQSVFTQDGMDQFLNDTQKLLDFFRERFWGGSRKEAE